MTTTGVLFFCVGLLMFFISIILFVFSTKNKNLKNEQYNTENERIEVEAILSDAKELLKQMDSYSSTTLNAIDEKVIEIKNMLNEFEDLKKDIENYKNAPVLKMSENKQYNIDKNDNTINDINSKDDKLIVEKSISNPLHKKIVQMYNNREKIDDISKQLNMGKNEVKLIINRYLDF